MAPRYWTFRQTNLWTRNVTRWHSRLRPGY